MISKKNKNIILIPARLNSSRLAQKLLLKIDGKSIIQHTYENSKKSKYASKTLILVDSIKLLKFCKNFTDDVILTSANHKSGTERIVEFLKANKTFENIVNVQGDEPFISPNLIDNLFKELENDEGIVTYGYHADLKQNENSTNEVKIVLDKNSYAIYFSRSPIPFNRDETSKSKKLIHIGLYGYKRNELTLFDSYKNNKLEKIEKLEQLRFIENRRNILVLKTEKKTIGIDTKNDFEAAIKYYFKKKSKSSFDRNFQK